MTESTTLHVFLAALLLPVGAVVCFRMVDKGMRVDLVGVAIIALCTFLGAGPLIACYYDNWNLPYFQPNTLIHVYAGIYLFLAGMLVVRACCPYPVSQSRDYFRDLLSTAALGLPKVVWAFWVGAWIVRIYWISTRGDILSIMASRGSYDMPFLIRLGDAVFNWSAFALVFWAMAYQHRNRWCSLAGWLILLTEFVWLFANGRRWVIVFCFAFVLVETGLPLRINLRRVAVILLLIVLSFTLFLPLFESVRVHMDYQSKEGSALQKLWSGTDAAIQDLISDTSTLPGGKTAMETHGDSMTSRPILIDLNAMVVENLPFAGAMWGDAILTDILHVFRHFMPFIWLFQEDGRSVSSEGQITNHFVLPVIDYNNNWPLAGLADFGLFGCFLYGCLYCALIVMCERLTVYHLWHAPFLAMLTFGSCFYAVAMVDDSPEGFLSVLRGLIVCYAAAAVYMRLRRAPEPHRVSTPTIHSVNSRA